MKRLKSVRVMWMCSFLLIITILMIILSVFFFYMRYMIQQEEMERNASENQFLKTVLDEKFMSVTNLAADIMYRPAQLFSHVNGEEVSFDSKDVFRLVTELESHCYSNSIIEDIFIYYPKLDFIIGANGPRSPQTYYYFYNQFSQDGYEDWKQKLLVQDLKGFFLYQNAGGSLDILYGRSLKLDNGRICKLYFKLSSQGITKTLEEANLNNINQFFAIMDYENQIYAYSGDPQLQRLAAYEDNKNTFAAKAREGFFISNQNSYIPSVYYLTVRNKSNVLKLSGDMPFILVLCLLLSIVASIPAAYYLSSRNMKPVRQLMTKLSVEKQESRQNEYDVIGQNLDRLMDNYSLAVQQLEEQQQQLTRAFVALILNGEHRDSNTILFLASIYGVELPYSCFCVVLTDISDIPVEEHESRLPAAGESLEVYHGTMEGRLVSLLNFDKEEALSQDPAALYIREVKSRMDSEGLTYQIAIGGSYQNPTGILFSYSEALYVLDTSQEKLFYYKDSKHKIGKNDNSTSFYEFQRYMMERNYPEADRILPQLFEQYLPNANPVVYKYRKSAVLQLVYDAIHRESVGVGAAQLMEQQYTEILFSKGSPVQIQNNIRRVLEQLAAIMVCAAESDSSLAGRAKALIDCTLSDPMLGLAGLAEKLNVSGAHLSRVFKREIGQGIAEYISRQRIDASKKLIGAGEMNVKTIALRVGFSTDANFIRVFKKYEKITPGKYESNADR